MSLAYLVALPSVLKVLPLFFFLVFQNGLICESSTNRAKNQRQEKCQAQKLDDKLSSL